jgi:hypothetical protein
LYLLVIYKLKGIIDISTNKGGKVRKSKIGFIREETFWDTAKMGNQVWHSLFFGYNKSSSWKELTLIEEDGETTFLGKKYKSIEEAKEASIRSTNSRYWSRKKLEEEYFSNGSV